MAIRPVFVPELDSSNKIVLKLVEFTWFPGLEASQKRKSVASLHASARAHGIDPILEVSTKSLCSLGQSLSAFNLKITTSTDSHSQISVESAYQGSKVFLEGGPYHDLYWVNSLQAKQDSRLKTSGPITAFNYFGEIWGIEPVTWFYEWLYLSALTTFPRAEELLDYKGFTDIEFNPKAAINCQARACALYVWLVRNGLYAPEHLTPEGFRALRAIRKLSETIYLT